MGIIPMPGGGGYAIKLKFNHETNTYKQTRTSKHVQKNKKTSKLRRSM